LKCTYHPDVETNLTCSNCGKPICPKDMVYTAVGIKCPQCARPVGRTRARGKPRDHVLALAVGVAGAVAGGLFLGELLRWLSFGSFILTLGYGYLMGEAISRAARRNVGLFYQVVGGLSTLAGLAMTVLVRGGAFSPFFLLAGVFAVAVTAARLRE